MKRLAWALLWLALPGSAKAEPPRPPLEPPFRTADVQLGRPREVQLADGRKVAVKLLEIQQTRDPLREAVREARVLVEIDGHAEWLSAANYALPRAAAGVEIDCPITGDYRANCNPDAWGLTADARLRLWPGGSPWLNPGTLVYPVKQRWFASATQMANEPCYVNACERPEVRKIYYHYGLDFGGCEGLVEVVAATDGQVVSARTERLPGYEDSPVSPRYDVVYVRDARDWFYRYSHLASIDDAIRPGVQMQAGRRIGLLGKEGGSGGWSHLHFDIFSRQPSGKWGCQEAYAFVWEAYRRQYAPKLIAVARPHQVAFTGDRVTLDGSRSWSAEGKIARYEWSFTDGTTAEGVQAERTYARPGYYSEILKVTGAAGRVDYDFAIVCVHDRQHPEWNPATIHAAYWPTLDVKAGDELTFKVRTFATTDGEESWDFGDGSPAVTTRSDGNVQMLAKDGYAVTTHRYAQRGDYLVAVRRTNSRGETATARLHVPVEPPPAGETSRTRDASPP